MANETKSNTGGPFSKIVEKARDVVSSSSDENNPDIGIGRDASPNFPDASIQPASDDTPPTEGGIDAAPHMADDDSVVPVGRDDSGPRLTPEADEEGLEPPRTPGAFETDPRGLAEGEGDNAPGRKD